MEYKDKIYGKLTLPDYVEVIIETEEFIRLKSISQLGFASHVFPEAHHNRYQHSIGTWYLASKLMNVLSVQKLEASLEDLDLDRQDTITVEIAALCHDLGHGPFSHFWDVVLDRFSKIDERVKNISHEDLIVEIWPIIKANNPAIAQVLERNGLTQEHEDRMLRLIQCLYDGSKDKGKELLFEVVSNGKSGLDVDKMEYLVRDSYMLRFNDSMILRNTVLKIINNADLVKVGHNRYEIGYHYSLAQRIYGIFQRRFLLHKNYYQNSYVKVLEEMAIDVLKYYLEDNNSLISYVQLNDVYWLLKNTNDLFKTLKDYKPCNILENIDSKHYYKLIKEIVKPSLERPDPLAIKSEILKDVSDLPGDCIRVNISRFSMGNKTGNPMEKIIFVDDLDNHIFNFNYEQFGSNSCETIVRVMCICDISLSQENKIVQALLLWANKNNYQTQ